MDIGNVIALISATAALVAAIASFAALFTKLRTLEVKIDGRLTQLLTLTAKSSHAEGELDEKSKHKK